MDAVIRPGAVTGFLGPNGAGKSTTQCLVLRLDRPTGGRALVNGVPSHLRALAYGNGIPAARVGEVLERTGLSSVAHQRIRSFSLGIAAALLGNPQILILDEPMNRLDAEGNAWIRNLMRERTSAGGTVFVSSHLMSEVQQVADELLVIGRGELIIQAPMAKLLEAHAVHGLP